MLWFCVVVWFMWPERTVQPWVWKPIWLLIKWLSYVYLCILNSICKCVWCLCVCVWVDAVYVCVFSNVWKETASTHQRKQTPQPQSGFSWSRPTLCQQYFSLFPACGCSYLANLSWRREKTSVSVLTSLVRSERSFRQTLRCVMLLVASQVWTHRDC